MVGGLTVDVESAFGFRWQDWGRAAALSWVSMFLLCWLALPLMWSGGNAGNWMCAAGLIVALLGNVVPGAVALACRRVRQRLRVVPEAAALSLVASSMLMGLVGAVALTVQLGLWPGMAVLGMVIGMLAFPMTFGFVFPLAIPLVCALAAWNVTRRDVGMWRVKYAVLSGIAAAGWLCVGFAGLVLAQA